MKAGRTEPNIQIQGYRRSPEFKNEIKEKRVLRLRSQSAFHQRVCVSFGHKCGKFSGNLKPRSVAGSRVRVSGTGIKTFQLI